MIGAGIVGRAILGAHVNAGVSVCIADQCEETVRQAVDQLGLENAAWEVSPIADLPDKTKRIQLIRRGAPPHAGPSIVIESIVERLDAKQAFFAAAQSWFGPDTIFCSNTSNLRISEIARVLDDPSRFAGMHFFMPVDRRPATEIVRGEQTSEATLRTCCDHAQRIHKPPLVVADGPGFIVNRLLSPYLNESLLLLCRGVTGDRIERAAREYGMPMSPLELIDYIGARTMFDAGRVFWQAFPNRLSPAPILSGLIKGKRLGRTAGSGLYDYSKGERSTDLAAETLELCERYRHQAQPFTDTELVELLSVPMWIEAALARRDGIAKDDETLNLAMRGGLGYEPNRNWLDFFDDMGSHRIISAVERWSPISASLTAPPELIGALREVAPTVAMKRFSDQHART